jgi:hypothetical protein
VTEYIKAYFNLSKMVLTFLCRKFWLFSFRIVGWLSLVIVSKAREAAKPTKRTFDEI